MKCRLTEVGSEGGVWEPPSRSVDLVLLLFNLYLLSSLRPLSDSLRFRGRLGLELDAAARPLVRLLLAIGRWVLGGTFRAGSIASRTEGVKVSIGFPALFPVSAEHLHAAIICACLITELMLAGLDALIQVLRDSFLLFGR